MNKYQEALNNLEIYCKKIFEYDVYGEEIEVLQELVDKATAKKLVDPYDDGYEILSGYCPTCGLEQERPSDTYCVDCGQRLDWSR
jgi:hypothetical protein